MKKPFLLFFASLSILPLSNISYAIARNELSIDVPFRGGGVVHYSRMWRFKKFFEAGLHSGVGLINNELDVSAPGYPDLTMETQTWLLPFIGPRVGIRNQVVEISLAFDIFYSRTHSKVSGPGFASVSGTSDGFGTSFYSPFLVLAFYNREKDVFWGFGLGGFWGLSTPKLKAGSGPNQVTTDDSSINTLTFNFQLHWFDGRKKRLIHQEEDDDF